MKQGVARVQCNCTHEFQDKQYGKNTRIANTTAKQDGITVTVRCTVCKTTQSVNPSRIK